MIREEAMNKGVSPPTFEDEPAIPLVSEALRLEFMSLFLVFPFLNNIPLWLFVLNIGPSWLVFLNNGHSVAFFFMGE